MVRITKTMQAKHSESLPPYVKDFRDTACSLPLLLLPSHLSTFATQWPFPRGDLYHWIPLLNRFDVVLETFCKTYKLDEAPQTVPFSWTVIESSEEASQVTPEQRSQHEMGPDGDRLLIQSILIFSRMLLQNCGNRSIYASSAHLNSLLNSTSMSLVEDTLHLALELAQRYQAAVKRTQASMRHINTALLANHYNIDLDRVLQIALPFTKSISTSTETTQSAVPVTPSAKGKDRAVATNMSGNKSATSTLYANDLVSLAKNDADVVANHESPRKPKTPWSSWGDVTITYYPKPTTTQSAAPPPALSAVPTEPTTPTPVRRASNLGPNGSRSNHLPSNEDASPTPVDRAVTFPTTDDDQPPQNFKKIDVSSSNLQTTGIHDVLKDNFNVDMPRGLQNELVAKLRVAEALPGSLKDRRRALMVRLLAISNLAYIHSETTFLESVLKQDSEVPRRLQLVYQLVDLIHPPVEGEEPIPRSLQIVALNTLSALAEHTTKFNDVCAALNTNVNHGVLLYIVRRVVAELKEVEDTDKETEDDIWRCAVFSLLSIITNNHRTGTELVSAGLVPILVEVLNMREGVVAGRYQVTVLTFLDNILYGMRDAFQTLVNADGLDAVSNLIVAEVKSSADHAAAGNGIKPEYTSAAVDYEIPFFQQQTLKWLFKFIHHVLTTTGGFGGNTDRLLRNLIDSSPLLASLHQIIGESHVFGSVVWTNAVTILNDFINNEPTSYTVIAEAGLSTGFLEAITDSKIEIAEVPKLEEPVPTTTDATETQDETHSDSEDEEMQVPTEKTVRPDPTKLREPRTHKLASGIMATSETINIIPQAFGSICLNSVGMKMFRSSKALERFFEIFESAEHVKCMDSNKDLPANLGGTFDELMRHHPPLRPAIMSAILTMVARVDLLCSDLASKNHPGAALWYLDTDGNKVLCSESKQPEVVGDKGKQKAEGESGDIEMEDVSSYRTTERHSLPEASSSTEPAVDPSCYITALSHFLSTLFGNTNARVEFITNGGVQSVVSLLESPCLKYNSAETSALSTLYSVMGLLAESKPHLTLPYILKRAVLVSEKLVPFTRTSDTSFFRPYVDAVAQASFPPAQLSLGTSWIKNFLRLQTTVASVLSCLQAANYSHGHRNPSPVLGQLNLADYYIKLVQNLGALATTALKEQLYLQNAVPDLWKKTDPTNSSSRFIDTLLGITSDLSLLDASEVPTPANEPAPVSVPTTEEQSTSGDQVADSTVEKVAASLGKENHNVYEQNLKVIRFSLDRTIKTASKLFQTLGKGLLTKRSINDPFQKDSHDRVAKAMVKIFLEGLTSWKPNRSVEYYGYWNSMLKIAESFLVDSSHHSDRLPQPLSHILLSLKDNNGLQIFNDALELFAEEVRRSTSAAEQKHSQADLLLELAVKGIKKILALYTIFVDGKSVSEAGQTIILTSRDKDRGRGESFVPAQFLIELRMAVLPTIRKLWESNLIESGSSAISDKLIEVIKNITSADCEAGAFKRSDQLPKRKPHSPKQFQPTSDLFRSQEPTYGAELTTEALYRCNNNATLTIEYLREATASGVRHPPPAGAVLPPTVTEEPSGSRPGTSTGSATPEDQTMMLISGILPPQADPESAATSEEAFAELLRRIVPTPAEPSSTTSAPEQDAAPEITESGETTKEEKKCVTIEDLNEERDAIRKDLIDKCLDVINAHGDVTFQVAELITTVVAKGNDPLQQRRSVIETLVVALLSFAGEEDLKFAGEKIAAYAHLLALLVKDPRFYSAAVAELKDNENLTVLLSFVRMSPSHSADDKSPWISNILLVIELLLSEDAKPRKTKWTLPKKDDEKIEEPVLEIRDDAVSQDAREQLFEALLDILPRVGKDESLALSVLRILVILTRDRPMALNMGEKKNIQRLFVMAKQLAGVNSSRIQSPLMMILRHIIEDDETVKQIMRADIKAYMENGRYERARDITSYLRHQAHLVARNPTLFVEVSNEMIKYNRWSYNASENSSRSNTLVLKEIEEDKSTMSTEDPVQPTVQATEDLTLQDVKASTENADSEMTDAPKSVVTEAKLPVVDHPDGVVHFLLCELLNYRDVEDKEPPKPAATTSTDDVSMSGSPAASAPGITSESATPAVPKETVQKPPAKQEFKPEEHPIYIYRCFLLQCLTELLSSYNRTKIEFINFKRSAPPQAMTPSKPRSSVVNYLLFDLVPLGSLEHAETPAARKRQVTSGWADSVLTALLAKTGEQSVSKDKEPYAIENEADLLFVRRFVLENILKAYREASAGNEPLEVKYARLLSLADLMSHIMTGKEGLVTTDSSIASVSQKQLRRIMFEKGFVAALTNSIADMDLNFPGAKRAVKYILRPLKTLTTTAITLSDLELISDTTTLGETDEIESATSVSDPEDEREETPDLFRNSTLGMFEPSREDDSDSDSEDEDEEMYEGEFGDEMEYDEEPDQDDVISEDDEDGPDGMGPIEGLSGDHGVDVEVIMEDDDDDEDEDDSSDHDEEDDDDDDEDDMDDDARIEIIDELGEVQELVEGEDMVEWESDGNDEENQNEQNYEDEGEDLGADHMHDHHHHHHDMNPDGALGQLLRSLGEGEAAAELLDRIEAGQMDDDDDMDEDEPNPDEFMDDLDEDEDDEDEDEEDMMFDYAMEGGPPPGWQDESDAVPAFVGRRNRTFAPFPMFPGISRDPLSAHRFHDPSGTSRRSGSRGVEDGVNPLLQRNNTGHRHFTSSVIDRGVGSPYARMPGMHGDMDIVDIAMSSNRLLGSGGGGGARASFFEEFLRTMPPLPPHFRDGNIQFHITAPPGMTVPRDLEALLGSYRPRLDGRRGEHMESPVVNAFFSPQTTAARWLEEAKLLFGATFAERALDIQNAVQAVLVPPAVETDKIARAAEAERVKKLKEEIAKKQEEERVAREAKAAEEKAAKEKKEAEEREAAEKAAAEAAAARGAEGENSTENPADHHPSEAMEGIETQGEQATPTNQVPPADRPRITTVIRGQPYDITDLGIDAEFLAELPEELREEVIMSAVAERRSQATATGAQPSDIDQEFLNALPDDIRAEIVQQERHERRRQQNQAARQAAAESGIPALDMDAASILATLDPALRNQVLLEQDEDTLAMLPRELADQARAAMGRGGSSVAPRHVLPPGTMARRTGHFVVDPGNTSRPSIRPARRAIVQMLDKPGVATLLRLMFIFQQGSLRTTLNNVLQNVSLNRHNRVEVLTTLLHILQDGSSDIAAVERSFAHLSLKAKLPKDAAPKTPLTLKRTLTGTPLNARTAVVSTNLEASPLMLVQQCLTCLVYLNQVNPHIPAFFLTEHDIGTGLKRTLSRKGKGKENKANKYALNTLLALLDRDLIMDSSPVMESLSSLLNMITGPLQALQRKQKESKEPKKIEEAVPILEETTAPANVQDPAPAATSEPGADSNTTVETAAASNAETTQTNDTTATPDIEKAETVEAKPTEAEKAKRPIIPPVVPEHNLQLIINIFVARECSSKTFRETLSTVKNLSNIPGAKSVFGRELITKAQVLAETILVDLQELLPQIERATTGTEIQGVALAKFSPGGSDQNKLLRVLTALDHLFDPKRDKKDNAEGEAEGESSSQLMEKQDLLSTLYENSTFAPMWEKLSACLSAIRQRENLMNVATILLPLIEALMVVCKNTTLKDQPQSQASKELLLTSPPPESRMENLFFIFTGEHRKILNELVRHTPKLMSGTFSLLVKNPKVLEFDNKRNYFSRSVHAKAPNSRSGYPPLQLSVRRDNVFHDSFKSLYFQTGDQMKYGKLSIRFHGEEGVDAGGVTREWFQVLSRQMFDPGYALWTPVSSDRTTFHPSQYSAVNEEHLLFFKFIGRIIGKALYEGRVLDCHFSRAVYRRILGKSVSLKDLESLDPDYHKSVVWMLENDITDIITETFSVDNDKFGVVETIDFVPNGRNIAVTEENKHEYVRLMVEWKLTGSVKEQLDEFLKGFHEIIPADLVSIFNEQELELLISGLPEIDVDDWKSNTELHNFTAAAPQIQWFWRAVRSFDKEERAKLLQFVTGTSKVPLNGFKELEGMNGFSRFNIHRDYGNKDRLPSSHTCFNQLDLPEYENYETLRQQLLTAITAGSEYFGFA